MTIYDHPCRYRHYDCSAIKGGLGTDERHTERLAELRRLFESGVAITNPNFQDTAKRVGIDNTYAAWAAWLGVSAIG